MSSAEVALKGRYAESLCKCRGFCGWEFHVNLKCCGFCGRENQVHRVICIYGYLPSEIQTYGFLPSSWSHFFGHWPAYSTAQSHNEGLRNGSQHSVTERLWVCPPCPCFEKTHRFINPTSSTTGIESSAWKNVVVWKCHLLQHCHSNKCWSNEHNPSRSIVWYEQAVHAMPRVQDVSSGIFSLKSL